MNKISKDLSKKILTIGPNYQNHRGGIGAVIEIYSKYFEDFKFLPSHQVGSNICKSFFFIGFLFRLIKTLFTDVCIEIVHIHGASYGSFFRKFFSFLIIKYIFRKNVVYHIHGAEYHLFYKKSKKITKLLIKHFINNADYIICLSQVWKDFFCSNFTPKRIIIVPNAIDYPTGYHFKEKNDQLTFLFLGIIGKRKGIFDVIQVIINNKVKYSGKIKLVVGGNGEIERLKKTIAANELSELVKFVGWLDRPEKIKWLQSSDIYILPSFNEGLPISILEAMAYGLSVISSNVGGIPEIVIPQKNGILIEPGNLREIESAIDFFLEHPETTKIFETHSKEIVKKHFPDSVIQELLKVYMQLFSR